MPCITLTQVATTAGAAALKTCGPGLITFLVSDSIALLRGVASHLLLVEAYLQVWQPVLTFVAPLAPMRGLGSAILLATDSFDNGVT